MGERYIHRKAVGNPLIGYDCYIHVAAHEADKATLAREALRAPIGLKISTTKDEWMQTVTLHWYEPAGSRDLGPVVYGVGTDAETITNAEGGKQSVSPARLDLIPPLALLHVGAILMEGAKKYGDKNWHKISVDDHLNHALIHVFAFLAGDTSDDHLGHFCCRAQMALERSLMDAKK